MGKKIVVELTVAEIDALRSSAISMHAKLLRDPHVSQEDIQFWYDIQDRLMMAKIRQT